MVREVDVDGIGGFVVLIVDRVVLGTIVVFLTGVVAPDLVDSLSVLVALAAEASDIRLGFAAIPSLLVSSSDASTDVVEGFGLCRLETVVVL